MSPTPAPKNLDDARRREDIAAVIAGAAADIDAVALRTAIAVRRLEAHNAEPNKVVAVTRAARALGELAAAMRRDGLLERDQQQLL
jgi:hypothetical protein